MKPAEVAAHRDAWADLAARALEPTIFNDPAFLLPAALHLPKGRSPRFLLAWDRSASNRLIGLCCLAPAWPGWPRAAWLHPQATAAYPLLDKDQPLDALDDLLDQMTDPFHPSGLLMFGLPDRGATLQQIERWSDARVVALETRSRAVARQPPPPLGGKAGKEFRRQERRLAELARVDVQLSEASGDALEAFLSLEAHGWKGRRGTALDQAPGRARFVRRMTETLASEGRAHLHSLDLDGKPIAMGLVLRSGPTAFFWKTAFDESFARFSPGAHLAAAIGRDQTKVPGITLVDSCAVPGHAMIDRLWPERMTVVDVAVCSPQSTRGFATAVAAERVRRRLMSQARRIVARRRPAG